MLKRLKNIKKNKNFYPIELKNYVEFFEKNYLDDWIKNDCLCGNSKDIELGYYDRHMAKFDTVICKNCGLIRAAKYLNDKSLKDFYKNHYRNLVGTRAPKDNFIHQYKTSVRRGRYKFIEKYVKLENKIVFDIGGSSGGFLKDYIEKNETYIFDYDIEYLNFAKEMGIKIVEGGLEEALDQPKKPDLVILSHVIEHWNNFEKELSKLYDLINLNTLVFIEVPGIDSLKNGRRHSDILGDIQIAHKYYFSKEVLKNILENHGFSVIDSDSQIKIIMKKKKNFKKNLKNNFLNTCFNLILAEIRMNLSFYKKKFF
ncbi:class I SAM-dependent methyltransferase [Pelagibacterales bacterium SAG-MED21]|nr:class I SAM-dependent methyltransferase [Pelagibacterales bacterium SAG-MED21]